MGPLGRRAPTDWRHVEKYPLAALSSQLRPRGVPVVIGVNWYSSFDAPVRDGKRTFWIGRGGLGEVRGGHCVCLVPAGVEDRDAWWRFYDQGQEGACVGFGCSRMMSLLNRKRYDARWLYHEARKVDEWPGEDYDGTSVRAALDVLRGRGHRPVTRGVTGAESPGEGIAANRWATSVDEVLSTLGTPLRDWVAVVNSWGESYPHKVRMPAEALDRLLREEGEIGLVVDR